MTGRVPSARDRVRAAAAASVIDATLDDVLSFLTPAFIARTSQNLPSPVSASAARRHFQEAPGRPMSVALLRDALVDELSWILLDPAPPGPSAFETVNAVLTNDLERGEQLRSSPVGRGAETLLILLLAVADSDPSARAVITELDRWFREQLELEYRAAGDESRPSLWCRELADVRYGELLYQRWTRTAARPVPPRHRDVLRWLSSAYIPVGVRRTVHGPRQERRLAGTEAPPMRQDAARTRVAILQACFVALADASLANLFSYMTPSGIAASAQPALDRTTVAELYSASAGTDAFSIKRLLYDLWPAGLEEDMSDDFRDRIALGPGTYLDSPGATESPEIDLWARLCLFEAALGDEHTRFRLNRGLMPKRVRTWLTEAGRQPIEPRDETLRFIADALGIMSGGKTARAKFAEGPMDPDTQLHAIAVVLEAQSEPIVEPKPFSPAVEPERGARLLGKDVFRYYARVTKCLEDFGAWLDEIHADINDRLTPGTPPEHFLMALGRPHDREVLILFESLAWVYRWDELEGGMKERDFLLLPSRWIRVESVGSDGYRWWTPMEMVDEALLLDAHARAGDDSPRFLVELERTPRGRTLIDRWKAWTSACICDGAPGGPASACIFDELRRQATWFLDQAKSRSLELHRERTRNLESIGEIDFIFTIPHLMRQLMGPQAR